MKYIFYSFLLLNNIVLFSLIIKNYLDLKKIKNNSLKNNKIIDYEFWGDFYE